MLGKWTLAAIAAVTTLVLSAVAVIGAANAAAGRAPDADAPTCWGKQATIVGPGLLRGTGGDDVIVARGGEVHAGGGDDLVCGAFVAYGGSGDDRIRYGGRDGDFPELRGGPGDDVVLLASARFGYLYGGPGDDTVRARHGGEQWLTGGRGDDVLFAGPGDDQLSGQGGRDLLRGARGHDVGDGGSGVDRCRSVEDRSHCER